MLQEFLLLFLLPFPLLVRRGPLVSLPRLPLLLPEPVKVLEQDVDLLRANDLVLWRARPLTRGEVGLEDGLPARRAPSDAAGAFLAAQVARTWPLRG